jgi:hypothetical protein
VKNTAKAILVLATSFICAGTAAAQNRYPLVFDSVKQLKRYGLALLGIGTDDISVQFPTRCYYYGDGGWEISISDALLSFNKSQGFSRRSACLALISGIRFNPESGKHLATYILVDRKLLRPKNNEPSALSEELPLSLPSCFRNGRPYSDCVWNYDPLTGEKLAANASVAAPGMWESCRSNAATRKFCIQPWTAKEASNQIDQFMIGQKDSCVSNEEKSTDPNEKLVQGTIFIRCKFVAEMDLQPSDPLDDIKNATIAWNSAATLYDFSDEFPKGYGYALFANGDAGGAEVSVDVVKAAFNGERPKAELDPNRLKEIWGTGAR